MRRWLMMLLTFITTGAWAATPYVYVPFTKTETYPAGAPLPASTGLLYDSQFANTTSFTNFAAIYHPASSGSFIDRLFPVLAPYVPGESWSLNVGGGGSAGNYIAGPGFSVNLLDTVRQELAVGLTHLNNPLSVTIANIIKPSGTGVNLVFGPQWTGPVVRGGIVPPLDQLRVTTHWYAGAGYNF
jgi:hypothetical protein